MATTEKEIVEYVATRISGAGSIKLVYQKLQIMSVSAALSSAGIEAEAR